MDRWAKLSSQIQLSARMVYYGALSKGCERCRRRKIKVRFISPNPAVPVLNTSVLNIHTHQCDQRKPGCLRCEKAKTPCPGFRNLVEVQFRDESERVIRRARLSYGDGQPGPPPRAVRQHATPGVSPWDSHCTISLPLLEPTHDVGANFFFAHYYVCNGPALPEAVRTWLAETYYSSNNPHLALRSILEAAGLAGISNVCHDPRVAVQSKWHYGRALAALNMVLTDTVEAVTDTALMTVILLGLYEVNSLWAPGSDALSRISLANPVSVYHLQ